MNDVSKAMLVRKWTMSLDRHLADRVCTPTPNGTQGSKTRRILRGYRSPDGLLIREKYVGCVWVALLMCAEDLSVSPTQVAVSYERIAQMLCIHYKDVSDAITLLTSLGFIQKKRRNKMTNVTRLFQSPHLPLDEWTENLANVLVDLEDVAAEDAELRERSRSARASESKPSRGRKQIKYLPPSTK